MALFPRDDPTGERLVKSADTAMYRAKELGRNRYEFFTAEMNARVENQLVLEAALRRCGVPWRPGSSCSISSRGYRR